MKRKFFTVMVLVLPFVWSVNAQTKEEIDASRQRATELQELLNQWPSLTGDEEIDKFSKSVTEAAEWAIKNSQTLENFYSQLNAENSQITLVEIMNLSGDIINEGKAVGEATTAAIEAGKKAKEIAENVKNEKNPMKVAKLVKTTKAITSTMDSSSKALEILAIESAAQGKLVAAMIEIQKGKE